MPPRIEEWPNKLGYNITVNGEEHEAWKLEGGFLGVRTFKRGTAFRHLKVPDSTPLEQAVQMCLESGAPCTDEWIA